MGKKKLEKEKGRANDFSPVLGNGRGEGAEIGGRGRRGRNAKIRKCENRGNPCLA